MKVNHGANLYDLSSKYGFSKEDFMDFSSNINPFGSSKLAKEYVINNIDKVSVYPDPEYLDLKTSISKYCNCLTDNILLGSGATELISSFIETINPKKALLLSPAYSEYEKELSKINCDIVKYFSKKENNFLINVEDLISNINENNYDLIVICNPNNPTGFTFTKDEIEKILNSTSSFVMVDETYIEFTNKKIYSSTYLVDNYENLFVIRGTSKFFSTPGIRLGYGLISNNSIKENINAHLDLWNINTFASMMGEVMFGDVEFIENTYSLMVNEREYLMNEENVGFWWHTTGSSAPRGISEREKIKHDWAALCNWYAEFLPSSRGKQWIEWFNASFPTYKHISDIKKVDFIIFATN